MIFKYKFDYDKVCIQFAYFEDLNNIFLLYKKQPHTAVIDDFGNFLQNCLYV